MTAREMIASSLRLIGVLASNEVATSEEANDALNSLNQMLSSWSTENLTIFQKVRDEFALVAATGTYTWGTGGDFNSSRPIEVISANLELQGTDPQEIPLKILTTREYAALSLKETTSTIPQAVYFDGTYPLQNVTFYPVPSAVENAVFYSLKPFTVLTLSTELSYPQGYEKAIRYNLAIDLAPEYGRQPDALIMQQAMDTKAQIKRKNMQTPIMTTDLPTCSGKNSFDYRTGE